MQQQKIEGKHIANNVFNQFNMCNGGEDREKIISNLMQLLCQMSKQLEQKDKEVISLYKQLLKK